MGLLDDFQLVSDVKDLPFITLRNTTITFSRLCVEKLRFAPYVHMYIDRENGRVAFRACEKDASAIRFYKEPEAGKQALVRLTGSQKSRMLMELAGLEDCGKGLRYYGTYYENEKTVVFEMRGQSTGN